MRIIRHPEISMQHLPAVITLGNFDGVHVGHQQILRQVVAKAKALAVFSVVIVFEPQANEYFATQKNETAPARLTRFREKINELSKLGIDIVLCLRFDHSLAALSATDFLHKIIFYYFAVKAWFVGDDFHFGANRQGDYYFLAEMARQHQFVLQRMPPFLLEDERVSSTAIRAALAAADLALVQRYLGRPYGLMGRVA